MLWALLLVGAASAAPLPATYLRTEYLVDPVVIATSTPRFSWVIPSAPSDRGIVQTAYQLRVTSNATGALVWDSGKVPSAQQNQVAYAGPPLAADAALTWTVAWWDALDAPAPASAPAHFGTAPGDDAAWAATGAQWIGCGAAPDANMLRLEFTAPPPAPGVALARATLYISGLGWHIAYLNGQRVSRSVFEPAFTHLRLRVLYTAHTVTHLLDGSGAANALAVYLGHGWPGQFEPWAGGIGEPVWNGTGSAVAAGAAAPAPRRRDALANLTQEQLDGLIRQGLGHGSSGYERRLRAWVSLHWADGSVSRAAVTAAGAMGGADAGASAPTGWQCGRGPLLSDDIYAGVTYDARREMPGWTSPGFNASAWTDAVRIAEPGGAMAPAVSQPVEVAVELPPCALWESTPGVWVFDFCQNYAGIVRLSLPGPTTPGTVITIRHAEAVMHPPYGPKDGTLYYGNLRSAEATDVYTTRGDDAGETWEPLFTWHGFRYISVEGLTGVPTLTGGVVLGLHFHSATPAAGALAFPSSADTLNQLQHAIVWTQASNILGNPSDCPQRDERMGWTGDAALVAEEFALNYDASAFLTQWAMTLDDSMHNTVDPTYAPGHLPSQVPDMTGGYKNSDASWSSVWPTTLYTLWKAYGDTRMVQAYWEDLVLYIDTTVAGMGSGGIAHITAGLGDWCPPGEAPGTDQGPKPSPEFSGGATFLVDLAHTIELAVALASPDAPRLQALWGTLAAQFNSAWSNDGAYYGSSPTDGAQCAQAQAIGAGVVPPGNLSSIAAYLAADVAKHGGHLSVGILGMKYLSRALTATGHSDTAVAMMLETTYPSFGWAFGHPDEPATTLWELWNAPTEGPGMNSRAHVMQASVGAWLYSDVAGIAQAPGSAGYASLLLWPRATTHPSLPYASGSYESIRGAVALAWDASSPGRFAATATVPANTAAEVRLPFPPGTPLSALVATEGLTPVACAADVAENAVASFSCPGGSAIVNVTFASFGTPSGTCAGGFALGACHAASSRSVVEAACLGLGACTVQASDAAFGGDPCNGVVKRLSAAVACSSPGGTGVVWSNGTYVPGVSGVTGAWVNVSTGTLSVAVGSGTYNLALRW